jgi:hypothetical protein
MSCLKGEQLVDGNAGVCCGRSRSNKDPFTEVSTETYPKRTTIFKQEDGWDAPSFLLHFSLNHSKSPNLIDNRTSLGVSTLRASLTSVGPTSRTDLTRLSSLLGGGPRQVAGS